ncbi:MAG: hypothetical protein J6O17_01285 [Eubacterium sp.]|nr:hypothetical protein [Eubacterium sp.]
MSMLFAILAIGAGTLGTLFFGIYGLMTTVFCVALSIVFIVLKRKKDKEGGIPSAIFCTMSMLFSIFLTISLFYVSNQVKTDAENFGDTTVIRYADDFKYGTYTVIRHAERDGVDLQLLSDELNAISQ